MTQPTTNDPAVEARRVRREAVERSLTSAFDAAVDDLVNAGFGRAIATGIVDAILAEHAWAQRSPRRCLAA